VEGNCHFLEFPVPKTHAVGCARELAEQAGQLPTQPKSGSGLAASGSTQDATRRERLGERGAMRAVKLGKVMRQGRRRRAMGRPARGQAIARQVPLYCFRLGKCGTFEPLFCVRGESRIAVVWTLFVAAYSAVAPVPFRVLSTHAVVLSAVDHR
jgi:hypothetical protein